MKFNQQLNHLQPSPIRSFNEEISKIEGLIPLTIGEPDFNTPDFIKEAAIQSIKDDLNGYSHSRGMIELRQAIARYVLRKYDLSYSPDTEIIVTSGPTQALFASFLTILNPGDKVLIASPNYVIYNTQVSLAHGEMVMVDTSDTNFIFTPEKLEAAIIDNPGTSAILLNHPANPTGGTYTEQQLRALVPIIEKYDLWVISDEIYGELSYDHPHYSMAKLLRERTILINGLSKSHAMTGWRSGFLAAPVEVANQLFKVHQAMVNTPNTQMQYASIVAYDHGDEAIEQMRAIYKERRDFLMQAFKEMNIETLNPQGAFYLFVKVPQWYQGNDREFCLDLAHQAKVGVVPGSGFGPAGKDHFRVSYAASLETLKEAIKRITAFVKEHQPS